MRFRKTHSTEEEGLRLSQSLTFKLCHLPIADSSAIPVPFISVFGAIAANFRHSKTSSFSSLYQHTLLLDSLDLQLYTSLLRSIYGDEGVRFQSATDFTRIVFASPCRRRQKAPQGISGSLNLHAARHTLMQLIHPLHEGP